MVDAAGRAAETHCGNKTNRANVSRGSISIIHTFLSITVRFFFSSLFSFLFSFFFKGYSTTATVGCVSVELSGPARRGAAFLPSTSSRAFTQQQASPPSITPPLLDSQATYQRWPVGRRAGDGARARIGEALFGREQERRRGLCWRVDIMKNYQWQGVSSNYPHLSLSLFFNFFI